MGKGPTPGDLGTKPLPSTGGLVGMEGSRRRRKVVEEMAEAEPTCPRILRVGLWKSEIFLGEVRDEDVPSTSGL